MKISLGADELDDLDAMTDEDLSALMREHLGKFRAKRGAKAEDDLENADPSSAAHGAPGKSTLETPASRAANSNTVRATDADVARLRQRGFSESRIREALATSTTSAADQRAAEKLIPSLGRLR